MSALEQFSPPWLIQIVGTNGHVIDALRNTVMTFDPDDDGEFWSAIVLAVNSHDALVTALENAIAAIRPSAGPEEKLNAECEGKVALTLAKGGDT